jgi:hypothetical protein
MGTTEAPTQATTTTRSAVSAVSAVISFSSLHVRTRYLNLIIPTSLSVRLVVVNSAKDDYRACFLCAYCTP